jgi:hypothetical protein
MCGRSFLENHPMASPIDICNMALAHLGETPNLSSINPPEGSAHAESCARFYPIARDVALEAINWPFAMARVVLAELTPSPASSEWQFAYALPADYVKAVGVVQPGVTDEEQFSSRFVIEGSVIYTNAPEATLRYVRKLTDTTKWSASFAQAVSWLLASYLAGAICEDKSVKNWAYEMYREEIARSAQSASNASQTVMNYIPAWIRNR